MSELFNKHNNCLPNLQSIKELYIKQYFYNVNHFIVQNICIKCFIKCFTIKLCTIFEVVTNSPFVVVNKKCYAFKITYCFSEFNYIILNIIRFNRYFLDIWNLVSVSSRDCYRLFSWSKVTVSIIKQSRFVANCSIR